jgi:5-formyltetrahydrofolate cyclo-ligase
MREIQKSYLASLTYKEKHSLAENLCEKITALPEYKSADLIMAYIPDTLEADCTPVILDALEKGKKVCVPKVDFTAMKAGQSKMDFYFLDGSKSLEEQLETGTYGIREPKSCLKKLIWGVAGKKGSEFFPAEGVAENATGGCSEGKASPSPFMIVPGVAFTKGGKRLGHGKGFYDIYIEKMCKLGVRPFLCGVCLPCQLAEEIPTDEHDIRMGCVLW